MKHFCYLIFAAWCLQKWKPVKNFGFKRVQDNVHGCDLTDLSTAPTTYRCQDNRRGIGIIANHKSPKIVICMGYVWHFCGNDTVASFSSWKMAISVALQNQSSLLGSEGRGIYASKLFTFDEFQQEDSVERVDFYLHQNIPPFLHNYWISCAAAKWRISKCFRFDPR